MSTQMKTSTVNLSSVELLDSDHPQSTTKNPPSRVKAYAKLEFPQHDFFIRKLSILIGRRLPPKLKKNNSTTNQINQPSSPSDSSSLSSLSHRQSDHEQIDVDLGPIRAVSRKHAALFYDWNLGRWSIQVLGRNGCVIDGRWKAKSEIVPLRSRTKIQIAERIFYFLLPSSAEELSSSLVSSNQSINPKQNLKLDSPNPSTSQSPINRNLTGPSSHLNINQLVSKSTHSNPSSDLPPEVLVHSNLHHGDHDDWTGCDADCESSLSPFQSPIPPDLSQPFSSEESSSESEDGEDFDDDQVANSIDDDHLTKSDDEPRPPSPPRQQGFDYNQIELIDLNLIKSDSDSDSVDDDDQVNSSSELLSYPLLPGKAPASKAPKKAVASKAPTGRGKSAGKRPRAHNLTTGTDAFPDSRQQFTNGSNSPHKSKTGIDTKSNEKPKQSPNKTEPVLPIKERRKIQCITPPGAEIGTTTQKPPYTYASLITQALASQADEDGKMLVSEMCEWMAGVYPFYGAKEKDWQSAVRHNLNADKRFKRIDRTPTDGGKGNFWTLKEEEWIHFDGLELRRPREIKTINAVKNDPKATSSASSMGVTKESIPSSSIGIVARSDIAAHHRVATPSKPLSQSIGHHGVRPLPPTPTLPNGLPVLIDTVGSKSSEVSLQESNFIEFDNDNLNIPCSEEREPDQQMKPSSTISDILPVSTPTIDPNLLGITTTSSCTSSNRSGSSTPAITQSKQPPPPPPSHVMVSALALSPSANKSPATTKETIKTHTAPKKEAKFEIIIQEPKTSNLINKTPKTQEELKKLMELEPPMYTNGKNQLILNKLIFNQLKPNQIKSLENLGSSSAIKILQKFIIEYFKEKLIKNNNTNNNNNNKTKNMNFKNTNNNDNLNDQTKSSNLEENQECGDQGIMQVEKPKSTLNEPTNQSIHHPPPLPSFSSSHNNADDDKNLKRKLDQNFHHDSTISNPDLNPDLDHHQSPSSSSSCANKKLKH